MSALCKGAFRRCRRPGDTSSMLAAMDPSPRRPISRRCSIDASRRARDIRDELLAPPRRPRWSCTVWPISCDRRPAGGRDGGARRRARRGRHARQRAIAERLLLGALRDQDTARQAIEAGRRPSSWPRPVATSPDRSTRTRRARRPARAAPAEGHLVHRRHRRVERRDSPPRRRSIRIRETGARAVARRSVVSEARRPRRIVLGVRSRRPMVLTAGLGGRARRVRAHGAENLAILRELGFGALLVVPLVVRATVLGTITFVSPPRGRDSRRRDRARVRPGRSLRDGARERAALPETERSGVAANEANRAKTEFLGT